KYIDARYDDCLSYMIPVMDQINMAERKLNDLLAKLAVVHQLIDEQLYNSSTTISKISSTHATKSGNDFNVAESGATALQIADMAIWYKELEAEIELAKKNEEYLMQLVHDWVEAETDDMVDLYTNQTMELWRLASQDMTQAEAENALDQLEILSHNVSDLYHRIDFIKSDFPSQNPWGKLWISARGYYKTIENCETIENLSPVINDFIHQLSSYDFPSLLLNRVSQNKNVLVIPSQFDINGEQIIIEIINGVILPETTQTRVDDQSITVVIPKSIKSLVGNNFLNSSIKSVIMENPVPPLQYGVTQNQYGEIETLPSNYPFLTWENNDAVLYVPDEAVAIYEESLWTYYFKSILPMSLSSVNSIPYDITDEFPEEIFNLNGMKVGNSIEGLEKGIYIVKKGNKTSKICIN
ncbi:MAG: hypothetical protein K2L34_14080, partial [Muribaculaceae bacterium]|nr:hypothetical protein [Muribaculaceae bacterium]